MSRSRTRQRAVRGQRVRPGLEHAADNGDVGVQVRDEDAVVPLQLGVGGERLAAAQAAEVEGRDLAVAAGQLHLAEIGVLQQSGGGNGFHHRGAQGQDVAAEVLHLTADIHPALALHLVQSDGHIGVAHDVAQEADDLRAHLGDGLAADLKAADDGEGDRAAGADAAQSRRSRGSPRTATARASPGCSR